MKFNTDAPKVKDEKPKLKILGQDGNAFMVLGLAQKAAMKAKWEKSYIDAVMEEMQSDDYNHLLQTAMHYFDVC